MSKTLCEHGILRSWHPTDKTLSREAVDSIIAWRDYEFADRSDSAVLKDPCNLNCLDEWEKEWFKESDSAITHVYLANMIHISEWKSTIGLLRGAAALLRASASPGGDSDVAKGSIIVYGPFKVDGQQTAPSNAAFDESLRSRDPQWAIRDMDQDVGEEAARHGLKIVDRVQMPANNFILILEPVDL